VQLLVKFGLGSVRLLKSLHFVTCETLQVEVEWNIETDEIVGKGEFKSGVTLDRYSNVPKEI